MHTKKYKLLSLRINSNSDSGLCLVSAYLFSDVRRCVLDNELVSQLRMFAQNKVGNRILRKEPKTIAIVQSGFVQQMDLTFETEGIN